MADQQYDNTNTGALFKNEKKVKDTHPDHKGEITVKCPHCGEITAFWLSAWIKEAKRTSMRFFSLAFTAKEEPKAPTARATDPAPKNRGQYAQSAKKKPVEGKKPSDAFDNFDDDIPF